MKNIGHILAILIVVAGMSACNEEWLETVPPASVTPPTFWASESSATMAVNAMYNTINSWDHISFGSFGIKNIYSDDADKGSIPGDGVPMPEFDELNVLTSNIHVNAWWNSNFQGVNRANQVLENVPKMSALDEDVRKELLGQAHFFRAYFFFNLVRAFGDVPKVDRLLTPDEFNLPRSPKAEIYKDIIIPDLTKAVEYLPEKSEYPLAQMGRITKGAARGMLAKACLFIQDNENALKYAQEVIESNEYSLMADYATNFRSLGENSVESLFEVQCSNFFNGNDGHTITQLPRDAGSGRSWGWGFNVPSESLLNEYEEGDPRKAATVITRGQTLYDGVVVGTQAKNPYYNYKSYQPYEENDWNGSKNIIILRYADVLLIAAEAANETGKTGLAQNYLEQVRLRARNGNTAILPEVTSSDKQTLRHAIWHERRVELAMESHRTFDLMRMDDVEPGYAAKAYQNDGKTNWSDYKKLMPVPAIQIDLSKGVLTQNPGY
ncbi:RagB/SusD family nutrient uptake outer membrane protein [Carboxylicivirga taeanensis]|uniref:RagB/SusD family nutrient uptake outer membrane protein n=1 Tax=Carboxylicivirga taeanensis TaxID=1416875 RepID=UPI003F6DC258